MVIDGLRYDDRFGLQADRVRVEVAPAASIYAVGKDGKGFI